MTKLNASGSALSYSTILGGSGEDVGEGIAADGGGRAYVHGLHRDHELPHRAGDRQHLQQRHVRCLRHGAQSNGLFAHFSTYLGGSSDDRGQAIAVSDSTGRIYAAGQTNSSAFPTTAGVLDTTYNGGNDAFVTKFSPPASTLARRRSPS